MSRFVLLSDGAGGGQRPEGRGAFEARHAKRKWAGGGPDLRRTVVGGSICDNYKHLQVEGVAYFLDRTSGHLYVAMARLCSLVLLAMTFDECTAVRKPQQLKSG